MSTWTRFGGLLVTLAFFIGPAAPARAQTTGAQTTAAAAVAFPTIQQVEIDYPYDADRYVVLTWLSRWMAQFAPRPLSQSDNKKYSDYQSEAFSIRSSETANGSFNASYQSFLLDSNRRRNDPDFRRSVMKRYNIPGA